MAPALAYMIADPKAEVALARTAAPPSISANATVLVLGKRGYETSVKGTNGFVCFVERSWVTGFDDPEFWNPKVRGPNCFNAAAVRTELPQVLQRTRWALAGFSIAQMMAQTRTAFAEHRFKAPAPDALSFMLSKEGYLNDVVAGPWHPHLMFFVDRSEIKKWGAGEAGSPIIAADGGTLGSTVLMIPVRRWSDGSPAP